MPYYGIDKEKYDFNADISIAEIKKYFRHHNQGSFFSMFETGLNGFRFDLIRIDPRQRYIRIFEFKSSRGDFLSDKKWQKYLKYCHTLTFVCPAEIIQKDDLPAGIGLLWIYKWKHRRVPASYHYGPRSGGWFLGGEWKKRPRSRDVDKNTLLDIAFMLVFRAIFRKDDVF